ncbi:winged helix-turn-helix domain-containing protein [Streptomyces sp. ISL-96]|uniref:AfsR/SARP family transcriptional regulator n=1 Tax=Streptomyces sp. ISL-96 TaxID=2819191 RepID=UPI001BE52F40|nr:AfsR/SARP family transcriptional regulator [Streptomyces sp. ISL-96]MBT2491927.1 winged helix-turn-helix domain-containing protein [Streptomyces sp. ISL-96]
MDFQLLGPVEAREGERLISMSGAKIHTVLAALLLARGKVVTDSRLSALLWGWDPPATMNAQIYTYISRLRKLLGPQVELVRRQPGYLIHTPTCRIDTMEFERLHRLGRAALAERRYEDADESLRGALNLWRGPALANVTPHLADAELPQLEETRTAALEHRIETDLALARHQQLIPELIGLVAEFPVRERLRAQLMTALYRCGRQADALHVYNEGREALAEELGVDPGADLNATYQSVLDGSLALARDPASVTTSAPHGSHASHSGEPTAAGTVPRPQEAAVPAMLPADISDFTGREGELAGLLARLVPPPRGERQSSRFRPQRLLITGMAGVGKTVLAVHAAHAAAPLFPDGQLYANLCHADGRPKDPAQVLVQLLRALGEPLARTAEPGAPVGDLDELIRLYRTRTAGRRLLILLDNAASDLQLGPLLPGTMTAAVLVTGRTRLSAVAGSHTTVCEPMGRGESLAMLSAVAGVRRIAVEPDAADAIAAYCGGLPLALRIAGARLASRPYWSVTRLAGRLADNGTRLHELRFGDLDVRQTLRSSMRRFTVAEHGLLRELAALGRSPFPAGAAAVLAGLPESAAEEFLERLVDVSLLDMAGVDASGLPQYRFHELVLVYAHSLPGARTVKEPAGKGVSVR